jgi:hypothetical protein
MFHNQYIRRPNQIPYYLLVSIQIQPLDDVLDLMFSIYCEEMCMIDTRLESVELRQGKVFCGKAFDLTNDVLFCIFNKESLLDGCGYLQWYFFVGLESTVLGWCFQITVCAPTR